MIKAVFIFALCGIFYFGTAAAKAEVSAANPVEISAAKSLEWDRVNKTYTAAQDVVVKQGEMKIESGNLVAHYSDKSGTADITTIEASNNVVITSPPYVAYGDKAVYNVESGNALLTGKKLTVLTDNDVMTADDKVEFFRNERKLVASGNPLIKHELDTISARVMTAYFKAGLNGKLEAEKITAEGGVVIKTVKETLKNIKSRIINEK